MARLRLDSSSSRGTRRLSRQSAQREGGPAPRLAHFTTLALRQLAPFRSLPFAPFLFITPLRAFTIADERPALEVAMSGGIGAVSAEISETIVLAVVVLVLVLLAFGVWKVAKLLMVALKG